MNRGFARFAEHCEYVLSRWWGFAAYLAASGVLFAVWGWDGLDRFTYLTNGLLVILLLNVNRRDSRATHIKLDSIDDEPHEGLEQLDEIEIDEKCESDL